MRSTDLTRQQLTTVRESLAPTLRYLNKMLCRMQHRYFPNDDPVWMATLEAQRAMQKLVNELQRAEGAAKTIALPMTDPVRSGYRLGRPRRDTH
jgi:hypothetical protein